MNSTPKWGAAIQNAPIYLINSVGITCAGGTVIPYETAYSTDGWRRFSSGDGAGETIVGIARPEENPEAAAHCHLIIIFLKEISLSPRAIGELMDAMNSPICRHFGSTRKPRRLRFLATAILAVLPTVLALVLPAGAAQFQLVAGRDPSLLTPAGGNDNSVAPVLTPDGRFVVFASGANNLIGPGNNLYSLNIFLRDRLAGATTLISINTNGTGGNAGSMPGQASTNGQFVVFQSDASDLVSNDTNAATDIFIRD
ncbi:MAG TPA: hypothetical protein VFV81_08355, partial [Verrucomicrobiae bacterium]|nr:hypothetical protein [Verrucomicrobiae bacterium]